MKLKVCGMKLNTAEVAALRPDYLGFIFWEKSSRFFDGEIPPLPLLIKKIGVFVDASVEEILEKIEKYSLHGVQLHGHESPEFCNELRIEFNSSPLARSGANVRSDQVLGKSSQTLVMSSQTPVRSSAVETSDDSNTLKSVRLEIIKVFSINDDFDFSILKPYEPVCDYFLFDTKGELPGGNGYAFDWKVLKDYPSTKPFFLSGGIGLEEVESIQEFLKRPEAEYCHAIDVNSRFEIEPGLKDKGKLRQFKEKQNL